MPFLVVGLGNPGEKYRHSRHNAGFMAVDKIAEKTSIGVLREDFGGAYGRGAFRNGKLIVFKPSSFMNRSGYPVRRIMNFYKIKEDSMVVVHDDMDLPLGNIRIKTNGGTGGHNGLKSVVEQAGEEFSRVRIGIGKPAAGVDPADYVLSDFRSDEIEMLEESFEDASEAVLEIISLGARSAMNKYNSGRARKTERQ